MNNFINDFKNIKKFENQQQIMLNCLDQSTIEGLNLEFGVYQAQTINVCSNYHKNKIFYGFDSFEGLPEDWRTGFLKGHFNLGGNLPKVNSNVVLIKGLFSDTLRPFLESKQEKISFLHIDCDLYSSTKCILQEIKNYISKGTIILFDEFYNYPGWENCEYKAWEEFASLNKDIKFEYIGVNINHEQVALRIIDV